MIERGSSKKTRRWEKKSNTTNGAEGSKSEGCPSRSFALPKIALAFLATASLSLALSLLLSRHAPFCAGDGQKISRMRRVHLDERCGRSECFQTGVGMGILMDSISRSRSRRLWAGPPFLNSWGLGPDRFRESLIINIFVISLKRLKCGEREWLWNQIFLWLYSIFIYQLQINFH